MKKSKFYLTSLICALIATAASANNNPVTGNDTSGTNNIITVYPSWSGIYPVYNAVHVLCYPSDIRYSINVANSSLSCSPGDNTAYIAAYLFTADLNQLNIVGTTNIGQKVQYDVQDILDGYSVAAVKLNPSSSDSNIYVNMTIDTVTIN
jgi:hypothetical protein